MWLHRLLIPLLVASLALPVVIVLLLAVGRLLAALGDESAAKVLDSLALAGGLLWAADLIGLVIVQGLFTVLSGPHPNPVDALDEELESGEE